MHQVLFDGVETDWHNALPLGNGRMGAMVFFKDNALHIALNHYDCYYHILPRYIKKDNVTRPVPGARYREIQELVSKARAKWDIPRSHYTSTLYPSASGKRPQYAGSSHPLAGEIIIGLSNKLLKAKTSLRLLIEEARVEFRAEQEDFILEVDIIIPKTREGVLFSVKQSVEGLLETATLTLPSTRGLDSFTASEHTAENTVLYRTELSAGEISETALYFPKAVQTGFTLKLDTIGTQTVFSASVRLGKEAAIKECISLAEQADALKAENHSLWKKYWKSTIQLPDKFLETLWYLHTYLIECTSGRGGLHSEQACGLNGLWDIRRPSMWGSMWYWDVNIQEAYWQTFSNNHLEQSRDFCDGYLAFVDDTERFAQDVYGFDGIAVDHPHALYNCIHPWCAQFLWKYYSYSGDRVFLEEKAYPVFQKQIKFIKQLAKTDELGVIHFDPDISPEQGPVTKDSVITISTIKQLLVYAIKAADILSRPRHEKSEFEELLRKLPEYNLTADGSRFRDSFFAPDDLPLRHPSILMPIFPAEEIDKHSPEPIRKLAVNTLRFAAENTELGMFGFGWIAAAAARMGEGSAALRILYEKGIDLCIHSNGMAYEETERWINHCVITKPALYWPAMMEPTGGIVGAVNEMLLQSQNGVIEVFPAIPNGKDRLRINKNVYLHDDFENNGDYPEWENCSFNWLLAQGGFVVSAKRQSGKTVWIGVKSNFGGALQLWLPAELSPSGEAELVKRQMQMGEELFYGSGFETAQAESEGVQMRQAADSHRRIFIGENPDTEYYKALDSFVCSFGFANAVRPQWTQLVFDFGNDSAVKNYDSAYSREFSRMDRYLLYSTAPKQVGVIGYMPDLGYGFADIDGIRVSVQEGTDDLRRDSVEGEQPAEFLIELPKGRYDILIISGDATMSSHTTVSLPQYGTTAGGHTEAGRYQCLNVPVSHIKDGILRIAFDGAGCTWKLNALFLNKQHGYL